MPHLVEVQGRRLTIELTPHVAVFRYADLPGMIGRVGTIFGAHGINISSAAVGHTPIKTSSAWRRWSSRPTRRCRPRSCEEIVASEGFVAGWAVELS